MESKKFNFLSVLVVGLFCMALLAPVSFIGFVEAPDGQQHNIWGTATEGVNPPGSSSTGTYISGWIDGVNYGGNTTLGTGAFDVYIDGDVWGLPEYEAVKDGGYDGDLIQYFLDYSPTDYKFTISSTTSSFTQYEEVDLFFDTQTDYDAALETAYGPGEGDTYLRGLKIQEICLNPSDGFAQYVFIYDPNGDLSEPKLENETRGYYLEKNDDDNYLPNGATFNFYANPTKVQSVGGNLYFVNLTGFPLTITGDELKLVWRNPGITGDVIANHTDVVVDRVEWGNQVNDIDDSGMPILRDYGNTSMWDCVGQLTADQSYKRNTLGEDTDNCTTDFFIGAATTRPETQVDYTVDYIRIDSSPGTEQADKPSVAPNYQEMGNCSFYNNSVGFLRTVSANWTVSAGASPIGVTPAIQHGIQVGAAEGDYWLNASVGVWTDSVMYTVVITGGLPGSPTDLRVHEGGGAWGGTTDDIVLYWTAPATDFGFLVSNLVYYDMDMSDGFQYTNWIPFDTNATVAGDPDWCILPGWLNNGNDYVFRVNTTGDTSFQDGGAFENMIGTNVGYKYDMILQANPTIGDLMFISIPYYCDYTKAEHIAGPNGEFTDNTKITMLLKWNYTKKGYDVRSWNLIFTKWMGNFTINPGDAIAVIVTASTPYTWSIVGAYDDTLEISLETVTGSDLMFVSLPYHKSYTKAEHIAGPGADFTDNSVINFVLQWNYSIQRYDYRSWNLIFTKWMGNFTVNSSPGDHLAFIVVKTAPPFMWKPQVMGF